MSDPHEPNTAGETTYAIAGGAILACVALLLVLSLRDTPGSPHGASLAFLLGGGTLSTLATFYLARRDR